ncbi:N-acyl homoserine lactonase family protein [Halorientalis salina]|uniref:N-acyl homoserine lactonase family protein n=1 Tax=Halorientalis salina TaxID=2932266 RepID=UPI0010AC1826|nr:N-acyl homoserine lactonase family protein [Halorientalis salina]
MVDATVTLVDRGTIRADANFMLENAVVGTADEPNPDLLRGEGPVYNLVIDHPEATILWDTGSHPDAGDGYWPAELYAAFEHFDADDHALPDALDDAGYGVDDIDAVVQTHLHLDHAGGLHNFAGTDVPVYVHEAELKYAYYSASTDHGSDAYVRADFDHDINWQVIHRDRETHFEDVEFLHLPGHTPGLLGTKLDLDGHGTVVLAGDQAYVRENYDDGHPMGGDLLWSKRDWQESLRWLRDIERRHDADVYCGHDSDDAERLAEGLP